MYPADKERRIGHFVADEMGVRHDEGYNYTFSSPGEMQDFRTAWIKVLDALTL